MTALSIRRTLLCALLCAAGTAHANLLVNGSFENGTFSPPSNDTVSLPAGSMAMPGWTVIVDSLSWIGAGNPFRLFAQNGTKFLDFTDYRDSPPYSGVTQTVNTTPGASYALSFYLGSSDEYGRPVTITASAGSTTLPFTGTATGVSTWELFTLPFLATGSTTAVTLLGTTGRNYIGLDNVDLVQTAEAPRGPQGVPEPQSLLLVLAGLTGVGAVTRRRLR